MSDEFKSYSIFPEGSYWVYEEVYSGFIDTLIVESVSLEFQSEHSESNIKVENGNIKYQTKLSGKIIGHIATTKSLSNNCGPMSSIKIFNSTQDIVNNGGDQFLDVGNQFFCCCDLGSQNWFDPINEYSGEIDSISVGNMNFESIRLFTAVVDDSIFLEQNPGLVHKSYFAKSIGLIKWEQFNGNIWEIRDFKINN